MKIFEIFLFYIFKNILNNDKEDNDLNQKPKPKYC